MSIEEIKLLSKSTPLTARKTNEWKKAFDEYNFDHPQDRPLEMNCIPCYSKVYFYILRKYQNKTN